MKKKKLYLFKGIFFIITIQLFLDISAHSNRIFSYPTILGNFSVKPRYSLLNWNAYCRISSFNNIFSFLEFPLVYRINWPLPLFGYDHLFDRVIFKVCHTDDNNSQEEPYIYFDEDGSKQDKYFLNERWLLSCWKFMLYVINGSNDLNTVENEIIGIVNHSKSFIPSDFNIKYSSIYLKFLHQPKNYQGDSKPWINKPFIKFCDIEENNIKFYNCNDLFKLETIEINEFKSKIISRIDQR